MENLKRGYGFLIQAWRMARADSDLLKPSIYALLAGLGITLLSLPLFILSALTLADRTMGQVVTGFLGILLLFAQLATGSLFSAMTIALVHGYLGEGDGRMERAWHIVRRDWLDILSLAAASTLVGIFRRSSQKNGKVSAAGVLGSAVESAWTEAAYLVLPAMIIEDIGLKNAILKVVQILREHLLLVGASWVGVRLVNAILGFLLGAAGLLSGLAVGLGISSLARGAPLATAIAIGLGVLIAGLFIMAAIAAGNYTSTAYHTCLYLWTRDVEEARQLGHSAEAVLAPAPLAAVL